MGALLGFDGGVVRGSYASGTLSAVSSSVGGLIGFASVGSKVDHSHSSVSVSVANGGPALNGGGLVGWNDGKIRNSFATGLFSNSSEGGYIAGLVGYNGGEISSSFATGAVSATGPSSSCAGLVGYNFKNEQNSNIGEVRNSYATGSVKCGGTGGGAGGLAGGNENMIQETYSTGQVSGASYTAGFVIYEEGSMRSNYWDTTTSGTKRGVDQGSSSGLQGLTTQQLQSGLPQGFSSEIWAEDPKINNGFPYLIHNPPPK